MKRKIIPYKLIRKSARRIGKELNPEKIILFGSYSQGKPNTESDVDFLIIFKNRKNSSKLYAKISKVLEPRQFPVDILIRSNQEIQYRGKIGDSFIQEILEKGKVLYES